MSNNNIPPTAPPPTPVKKSTDQASVGETLTAYANSPLPALVFSGSLFASPLVRPSNLKLSTLTYPNNLSVGLFGAFTGLGAFLTFDSDPVNGAGVTSAWSFMYLLINGRKSIVNFSIYPKYLSSLALVNTAVYGGLFFGIIGGDSNEQNQGPPLSS
ncbi:unnamed protein product [Ambrosiozyma monospora]|uniref:Unnamed protein product n=1 Tax=Ambrosiozyma monospora TaxID=43982 RepID=A0A9W6YWL3_AMBMO|nr:unnamed protein product [Ambrosiozyma monospora]